jgi:hypothetical protein
MVVAIGPTEQDPGAPPLLPRLLKFDGCQGDDFTALRSKDPNRIAAFLLRPPAAVVCAILAATDGDIQSLPLSDTSVETYSLSKRLSDGRSALVAGALTDVHVVPVTGRGELVFRDVASWVREGQHGLNVTGSVRSLYDQATDGFGLGSVVALHAYVHESMQSRSDAFAAELAEADALEEQAAVALDGARSVGKFSSFVAVLFEQDANYLASLRDPDEAHFRVKTQHDVSHRRNGRENDRDGVAAKIFRRRRSSGGPSETIRTKN